MEVIFLESILNSLLIVTIAEIGDKTQLLSLLLTLRFRRKPWQIIAGIFLATLLNHWLAALAGNYIIDFIDPDYQKWFLAFVFAVFGFWALIPDKDDGLKANQPYGALITSLVCFFIAEMGDKTQLATVALGAQYQNALGVAIGTTIGMLIANIPVVLWGNRILRVLPLNKIRIAAALLFFLFAVYIGIYGLEH